MGPWSATTTPSGKGKVVDRNGFSIANMTSGTYVQQERDANLIAAAPEMYAKLVEVADALRAIKVNIIADDIDVLLRHARGEE